MPAPIRWLFLNLVVLPRRPRVSAAAYEKIWTGAGSPLLVHSLALREAVAKALGDDFVVEVGMRYGKPSLASALDRLAAAGVAQTIVFPLFPQNSAAATRSALARVYELAGERWEVPTITALGAFFDDPGFIEAWSDVARGPLEEFRPDHVLYSYHGLPENQIKRSGPEVCLQSDDCCAKRSPANRDCYRNQCFRTTELLNDALGIEPETTSTSFQSRLGRTPWIRPFTDVHIEEIAAAGHRRLAVLCPAFVADNLETLEEIGIRLDHQWRSLGGESLRVVPCPNSHPTWVRAVADIIRRHAR